MAVGETTTLLGWGVGLFTWDGILHLILPAVSSLHHAAAVHPAGAPEMLEQLSSEYVKFARAKGWTTTRSTTSTP